MKFLRDKRNLALIFVKTSIVILFAAASVTTSSTPQQRVTSQCVSESGARYIAVNTVLPEYPEGEDADKSQGVVFAAVLFGPDGKQSRVKFLESPSPAAEESVKKALDEWKLKPLYDSSMQLIETRTGVRFHFIYENGKGRVEPATENEQKEGDGLWAKKVCRPLLEQASN